MRDLLLRLMARYEAEKGQTMVEYGLILALISVAAIAVLGTLGRGVVSTFSSAAASL